MVNHPPPFHKNRKGGVRRKAGSGEREERTQQGNTMVFGITCVLAGLRAHYPEHQHKEEREEEERERKMNNETTLQTPTAIPQ